MRCLLLLGIIAASASAVNAQEWSTYGGNGQHVAQFNGASQSVSTIHWQASLDDDRAYYGGGVLIHYASPVITAANTVVHSYRYTTQVSGSSDYDNWRVIGRSGKTGAQIWSYNTGYSATLIWPNSWTSVYPLSLVSVKNGTTTTTGAAMAGPGGTLLVRTSADAANSTVTQIPFYTSLQNYNANSSTYSVIKISTPLTSDPFGNVYFGYVVTGPLPSNLSGTLGTGGVAKVNPSSGATIYASAASLGVDPSVGQLGLNASPALSNDFDSIYVALCPAGGGNAFLAKLSSASLTKLASVAVQDPSVNGPASLPEVSSASPMVGPDGHVFMGVFRNQYGESHGWMVQYDSDLSSTSYPTGAFGWDDTASVVPARCVPSYTGKASYLILTKYNNYADFYGSDSGATGDNHVAVLDPTSSSITRDRQTGIPVMNEVLLILGPTPDVGLGIGCCEWCINSAVVDINKKGAIINSEDGHTYRWDFTTNKLTQGIDLEPPTGEAYTSTVIGPDGTIYAINNSVLFAIGNPNEATSVSVFTGISPRGSLGSIFAVDGNTYSVTSVPTSVGETAGIEADFTLSSSSISALNISTSAAGAPGATYFMYAYNYTTQEFVEVGTGQAMSTAQIMYNGSLTTNASQFESPSGVVRIVVRAIRPTHVSTAPFTLAADMITCSP